ncbi:hypothetical protein C8Q77DRAFT_1065995 [Trametes polyzona]|nr:hypothetical protein C8Q77DRAFT_1065995 [Trametes polyzona]
MANTTSGADTVAKLLDGDLLTLQRPYSSEEASGVLVLAVISCISATAVVGLLLAIAVSAFNTRKSTSRRLFVRSHVAAYFVSMLFCELVQTVGSIMNVKWVAQRSVTYEPYCTVQGVVKHISDVGTAYWCIIATNTFWILFLQWRLRRFVLIGALVGGWSTIGAIVSTGPGAIQKVERGPFYAISGYWCWIADEYPTERITLDYMIMFLSALLSFIMYVLVFLRMRGNIMLHGWRVSFRFGPQPPELAPKSVDTHAVNVAKSMLLYPLAYMILVLPIAISRFAEWMGHEVPFAVTMICDSIFLLSGFVNVVLFLTTRRVLPANSVFPRAIAQRFSRPSSQTNSMSSIYSEPSSTVSTDIEKVVYAESTLSRTDSIGSLGTYDVAARAPSRYPDTPNYSTSPGTMEGYDCVSLTSAAVDPRLSWTSTAHPPAGPLNSSERVDRRYAPSPTLPVAIPSGAFNPFGDHLSSAQR